MLMVGTQAHVPHMHACYDHPVIEFNMNAAIDQLLWLLLLPDTGTYDFR